MEWVQDAKAGLQAISTLERDALHIYIALAIHLTACWVFRLKLRDVWPWIIVLAMTLTGESVDLRNSLLTQGDRAWQNSFHDLWNTMVLPTVLLLVARFTTLFAPEDEGASGELAETSGDEA
ncbi:hypothetical protein [Qipengyuania sp. JC766]|uniref:hypothetical protein n=1 Tax=Qipengyuania sp. JC766 TaxID=3232139 RepID=UPI0034578D83